MPDTQRTETVHEKDEYDFTRYIMDQGKIFEDKVFELIYEKFGEDRIIDIQGERDSRNPEKATLTFQAMNAGIPIIRSGVLHNPTDKTFGVPDLLVRSDWLSHLTKDTVSSEPSRKANNIPHSTWHYLVVDIKYTTLMLRADGIHLLNSGRFSAYKAQVLICNRALGWLQGYTPRRAYILGRKWVYHTGGRKYDGDLCFDKLGTIDYHHVDNNIPELTDNALRWLREVYDPAAAKWDIYSYPLEKEELYPNMCNQYDQPWHDVKEQIAKKNHELTALWMVGPKNRKIAMDDGVYDWKNKYCNAESLGITGSKTSTILNSIIHINKDGKRLISPTFIENNIGGWKSKDKVEFFVDFETTNGCIADIDALPMANTNSIVFMFGVGYMDGDEWIYKDFTVDRLTDICEKTQATAFMNYIINVSKKFGIKQPKCYHWSHAERYHWQDVVKKHKLRWTPSSWLWVDLLEVFKEEPIVIKGCMTFGLKDVAKNMYKHGFIKSKWEQGITDGRSAMIAARVIDNETIGTDSIRNDAVMQDIIKYNSVDVVVLYEILVYLREYHVKGDCNKRTVRDMLGKGDNGANKRRRVS